MMGDERRTLRPLIGWIQETCVIKLLIDAKEMWALVA